MKFSPLSGATAARTGSSIGFETMLVISFLIHVAVIFGVRFVPPLPKVVPAEPHSLQVVLVNRKTRAPTHADVYAQVNAEGGGTSEQNRQAKSPLPYTANDATDATVHQKQRQVTELEAENRKLTTQIKSLNSVETKTRPKTPGSRPDATDLLNSSFEAARLQAQIDREQDYYQKRPRLGTFGAIAKEYVAASYIEDWRQKVEKVGNLNYPEEAKSKRLYGALMLTVYINADGAVRNIELNRSSGHKVLDEAAMRIVRLASPYAPFPRSLREKYDVITITRTWTFTRADALETR